LLLIGKVLVDKGVREDEDEDEDGYKNVNRREVAGEALDNPHLSKLIFRYIIML
jgi:hypothetical protein